VQLSKRRVETPEEIRTYLKGEKQQKKEDSEEPEEYIIDELEAIATKEVPFFAHAFFVSLFLLLLKC